MVYNMDKVKHFGVCFAITLTLGLISPWLGALVALGVGIEKERRDKANGGKFDLRDIAADVAGIGAAMGILWLA